MKRTVQIYVEGYRIELFNDEKISVSSSVQNVSDISKVFTDFSQSFTVPASDKNNPIFEHYYNNDLDGTINHNLRRDAWIEIDLVPFRKGKLQLEKANIKDGRAYSYTVTFYGDVTSLKDLWGDLKLSAMDYSAFSFLYSGDNIQEHIENNLADYDVKFPFISSQRLWQWNEPTTPYDNIDTSLGAVNFYELYPAIRIKALFDLIQSTYGITFTGTFLLDTQFTKAFLYCKNKESFKLMTDSQDVNFSTVYGGDIVPLDATLNTISLFWRSDIYDPIEAGGYWESWTERKHTVSVGITTNNAYTIYFLDIYKNGNYISTYSNYGNQSTTIISQNDDILLNDVYTFKVRSENVLTIDLLFTYNLHCAYAGYDNYGAPTNYTLDTYGYAYAQHLLTANINIANYTPDIKIADFFSGVLKEFNLTCYGTADKVWQIEPLEDWYNKGTIYNITPYTGLESIDVERIKLYKRISFEYQKSESFMNRQYKTIFEKEYGNLNMDFPYDGGDYLVQSPFEDLMFNRFTGTDIQVGYCLTPSPDYKPYIPKPIILYFNGYSYDQPYFKKESTTVQLYRLARFGQDFKTGSQTYSLNWGADTSTYYQVPILDGLYQTFYYNYLTNLFSLKNRMIRVKCLLPLTMLTELKLNDRLIIRDKRYIINEMNSELTSGEVTFTLLNDFRTLKRSGGKIFKIEAGDLSLVFKTIPVLFANKSANVTIDITGTGVLSVSTTSITEDTNVDFEFPINPDLKYQIKSEDSSFYIVSESNDRITNEEYKTPLYSVPVTYEFMDGTTEIDYINIQQEAIQ